MMLAARVPSLEMLSRGATAGAGSAYSVTVAVVTWVTSGAEGAFLITKDAPAGAGRDVVWCGVVIWRK